MKQVPLEHTGSFVSKLCFGTMTFGRECDAETSTAIYQSCRDAEVNYFDCANVYAKGESERILGKLIAGHRDEVIITSKVAQPTGPSRNEQGYSRRYITQQIDASLKRLGTDRLDVYYLHHFDPDTPIEQAMQTLNDLVRAGKILHIGMSNHASWQIQKAIDVCEAAGYEKPCLIQPMYNLLKRQAEVELLPMALVNGLSVSSYSPLAAGLLTGKYKTKSFDADKAKQSRLHGDKPYQARYGQDRHYEIAQQFVALAQQENVNPVTLAIAWVSKHPAMTSPILGARSVEQLKPALAAASYELSDDIYQRICDLAPTPPLATDRTEEQAGLRT